MIRGMAIKILSDVEVNAWASNQHEFHGVAALKSLFGYSRTSATADCFYLHNGGTEGPRTCSLTWYDARENHPTRSEYRLYYDSCFFYEYAKAGDTMVLTIDDSNSINIFVIARGTQAASCLINTLARGISEDYQIISDQSQINAVLSMLR
ncbi:MAG: hypothetical protein IKL06_06270 [Lachnospiraceae bacterium]|nr:hypothetical protein [Lachnospiraceae bacterium]